MDDTFPNTQRDDQGFITLIRKYSALYKKVSYLAPLSYCTNMIYEYDIKQANVSVMRYRRSLPVKILNKLASLDKNQRNIVVGKMLIENKALGKDIAKGIIEAKQLLFEANHIQDAEVLSIKNDAVFVVGQKLKVTKFGPIEFVIKNSFSMYQKINNLEFYYNKHTRDVVIKGLGDAVIETGDHCNGMLEFIKNVFDYVIYDRKDALRKYLIEFSDDYKNRRLPYQYYREMNSENIYRFAYEVDDYTFNMTAISPDQIEELNITYNYMFYVLPLIRQYI